MEFCGWTEDSSAEAQSTWLMAPISASGAAPARLRPQIIPNALSTPEKPQSEHNRRPMFVVLRVTHQGHSKGEAVGRRSDTQPTKAGESVATQIQEQATVDMSDSFRVLGLTLM